MSSTPVRLVLLLLLAAGSIGYYFGIFIPQTRAIRIARGIYGPYSYGGDFYPVWLTSRQLLTQHESPYSEETTREIQAGFFGAPLTPGNAAGLPLENRAFAYPLYADLLAAPVSELSFRVVQLAGAVLFPLIVAATVFFWFHPFGLPSRGGHLGVAIVLVLISYPALEGLYALQASLIVSLIFSVAMALLVAGRNTLAGIALAVSTIKPQLSVILILFLFLWAASRWRSRWPLVAGFLTTLALLLLASWAILPGWLSDWWHAVLEYRHHSEPPPLAQLVLGKLIGAALAAILLVLVAWVAWRARNESASSSGFGLALGTSLASTVILLPSSVAVYDHIVLIPGILWLYKNGPGLAEVRRGFRWLCVILGLVLGWQWIAASGVAAAAVVWSSVRHNPFAILLPLRAAAALPFVVTAALVASRGGFVTKRG